MFEPWRPRHRLESPLWKIRRAQKHLETLNSYTERFNELGGIRVTRRTTPDDQWVEYVLESDYPPFIDYALTIGEFTYQLRSALDQVIFALCRFPDDAEERERAERSSAFPILRAPNASTLDGRTKYLQPEIRDAVRQVVHEAQPYNSPDPRLHFLSLLDEMNVLDKHRLFEPAKSTLTIDKSDLDARVWITPNSGTADGEVLARVPPSLVDSTNFPARVTAGLAIQLERPGTSIPLDALGQIYGYVAFDLIPQFHRFFEPLPPTVEWPTPGAATSPLVRRF